MRGTITLLMTIAGSVLATGCDTSPDTGSKGAEDRKFEARLQEQLLDAKPGSVVVIPAGRYALSRGLSVTATGVTIRGAGMGRSILSFADQKSGAEGVLVTGDDFTIEDVGLEDSKGDALKINGTRNAVIRRVRAEWTGGARASNGAYGLYPVQVTNVLIEGCIAKGASDAGIYVGQSTNVVVRRNRAEQNVAGIEIENSTGADVYENVATGNSGGILVFNMPDLPVPGSRTRVYGNKVLGNNHVNFGAAGSAVRSVPPGSGIVVNSNDQVEIFDNDIADNQTANVIISSYFSAGFQPGRGIAPAYDPYPENIYVTGNRFVGGGNDPGPKLAPLKQLAGGAIPAVLWDGFVSRIDPRICVQNGGAKLLNADAPHHFARPRIEQRVDCKPPRRLPAIELPKRMIAGG
jgi:parallel beta-helix repeat protein